MHRAYEARASAVAPTAPTSPSIGYPTAGDPISGALPTVPGPWWFHMVTEELMGLLISAGISPSASSTTQVLSAIDTIIAGKFSGSAQSLGTSGYQKLPGGLIVQWGQSTNTGTSTSVVFPTSFLTAGYAVCITCQQGTLTSRGPHAVWSSLTSTGFQWASETAGSVVTTASTVAAAYIAIGK